MEVVECRRCGRSRPVQSGTALGESCPYCLLMFMFGDDDEPAEDTAGLPPKMPERLGPYRLLEPLGAGGMGTVYRAQQEALDRTVALKVLRPEFAARVGFRERFQHEGRILASLTHPHIVGIHDTGCDGGMYYLAMEYVAGATLRAKLDAALKEGGPLTTAEAVRIVDELCAALDYAHGRGIVHRDLKPENVLLDAEGRAKIVDFGVAKLVAVDDAGRAPVTEVDTVVGTRRYMAPEQLEPGRTIDRRADLYSLAAVLYEMLTGSAPLGAFGPPSSVGKSDPRLDSVVMRGLAREPNDRPADARTFAEQVRAALSNVDEPARSGGALARRRMIQAAATAVAGGALGMLAWRLIPRARPDDALAAIGARRFTHPSGVWRSAFLPDGATLITACGDRQVRLWPTAGGEPTSAFTAFPHGELGYLSLAASPDGSLLATAGGENVARIWDLKSRGERFTLAGHSREIVDTAWSPDGTLIATAAHDKSVRLWSAADGTLVAKFDALPDPALCVAFSPDGKLLAAGIMNGAIKVWDVATRTMLGNLGHQKRVWSVAFGRSGDDVLRLVSGSHDRTLKVWTFEPDGTVKPKPTAVEIQAGGEVWSTAVSPHGDLVAAGLNDGTLSLRTFPEGKPLRKLKEHTASVVDIAFSPDGTRLATSSLDGSAIVWDLGRLV